MLALAMCNIVGSFIMAMPTCGAFTRSALSQASGVKTTMSNFYSSVLVLLAILFLTPHFHLIPRAVLSSVLISAVIFLVDYQIVKPLWKTNSEFFINPKMNIKYFSYRMQLLFLILLYVQMV